MRSPGWAVPDCWRSAAMPSFRIVRAGAVPCARPGGNRRSRAAHGGTGRAGVGASKCEAFSSTIICGFCDSASPAGVRQRVYAGPRPWESPLARHPWKTVAVRMTRRSPDRGLRPGWRGPWRTRLNRAVGSGACRRSGSGGRGQQDRNLVGMPLSNAGAEIWDYGRDRGASRSAMTGDSYRPNDLLPLRGGAGAARNRQHAEQISTPALCANFEQALNRSLVEFEPLGGQHLFPARHRAPDRSRRGSGGEGPTDAQ